MNITNDFIASLKPSAIRKITSQIDEKKKQGVVIAPFAGGRPDKTSFPMKELVKIAEEIFAGDDGMSVQYEASGGYGPLREALTKLMAKVGVTSTAANILPFSGSTQALAYVSRALLNNTGNAVICEQPSYTGALDVFRSYGNKIVGIPLDEEGIDCAKLEDALKSNRVAFIYVIPDFQNPTGSVMSMQRRKDVLALARKYDVPLIEDAPYTFLGFDGKVMPAIKSMDTEQRVIYIGSFSKTIAPGVRVGWLDADPDFVQKMVYLKMVDDLQGNNISQRLVYRYLTEFDFDAHLDDVRALYRQKGERMTALIKEHFPKETKVIFPRGGMFLWMEFPEDVNTEELFDYVFASNIAFVPGTFFFTDGSGKNTLRLNYSMPSNEEIDRCIPELGRLITEYLNKR